LARSFEQSEDPAQPRLPTVILHLRSGRDLSGRVVSLGQVRDRGQVLILQISGDGRFNNETGATYVPLDAVEAVTVLEADRFADLLSDGTLAAPPSNEPAPSRLDIVRAGEEAAAALAKERGVSLKLELEGAAGLDGEALRGLSIAVREAFSALSEIAGDELGKEALSGVQSLRLANGPAGDVQLAGRRLTVSAALSRGRSGRLSKADLKSRISALF
jgi:hypothetical protein